MNYPAVGSSLKNNACRFTVWAPLLKRVDLMIQGSDSAYPMTRSSNGYWSAEVEDIRAGTSYFFRLDEDKQLPDPASRAQQQGVHGPSTVVETEFNWNDQDWKGLSMADMIIYELHVGTFTA